MCWLCDALAPTCPSVDSATFADFCDEIHDGAKSSFRAPTLRDFLLELADSRPGRRPSAPKEPSESGGKARLRTVHVGPAELLEPKELRAESVSWYNFAESEPSDSELNFFALEVVYARSSVAELTEWVASVLCHEAAYQSQGAAGLPADWKPSAKVQVPAIYAPIADAIQEGRAEPLQRIASAMSQWRVPGWRTGLDVQRLRDHAAAQKRYKAKHSRAVLHWKTPAALFGVARRIKQSRLEMQRLLGEEQEGAPPPPTREEAIIMTETLGAGLGEAEEVARRKADAARVTAKRLTDEKVKTKSIVAANKENATAAAKAHKVELKATKAAAKTAMKAILKEKVTAARERARPVEQAQAEGRCEARIARFNNLRNAAHSNRRRAEAVVDGIKEESAKRLRRAVVAEVKLGEAREELAEFSEHYGAALAAKRKYTEFAERYESIPSWRLVAKGRGAKQYDYYYRRAVFMQYANGTPRSAIGPNIEAIVRTTAPWLKPQTPSPRFLTECRFEMRTVLECLCGREVAAAYRIRLLGFDESCKYGNAAITSNVVVEPTPGEELKVVVLRGVYISAGGTAVAISKAINEKCFGRLRDLQRRWRQRFEKDNPGATWTGPEPERLSLARLGGGGAIISDTCNTAHATQELLESMIADEVQQSIGAAAWAAMSDAQRRHATRVHKLDCWQHMRNIFLNAMSAAQAAHVAEELKPWLDAFGAWDRMTTDFCQLLRAAYKEFQKGNKYYKGKGREFWVWLLENHGAAFVAAFERAEGGRQDLDYDAAVPLYIMRKYIIEFLHTLVHGGNHSNILEDFLYISFSSAEFIAMTRANAIVDIVISMPLRWLSGNAYKLDNFSPLDMRIALRLVHDLFEKVALDGSVLLDPDLDLFGSFADTQPLFAEWRKYMFEDKCALSADGTTSYLTYKLVRDELLDPRDPTNQGSRLKTIEYLEVQAKAALLKINDPKLALARNLAPVEGVGDVLGRADTIGLDATNDRLSESIFGMWDYILRRNPGITLEAASALVQAMAMKAFDEGGMLDQLPEKEARALFDMARTTMDEMRVIDRADHAALDAYHTSKRKSNSQLELDALVKQYALALSFFARWQQRGVSSPEAAREKLDGIAKSQDKLDWLREQIEMRVIGLGFDEFKPAWSSSKDENVGTVDGLSGLLRDILMEEAERRGDDALPSAAVVPQMRRKTFKELGTPTVQATELADKVLALPAAELLQRAQAKRQALCDAGELDEVGDEQPEHAPARDASLVGAWLEIRWRYWEAVNDPTGKDKRKKKAVDIWCEGEVMGIANGTTDKEGDGATCKKIAKAGAVRMRWPEDKEREVPEPEHFTWCILTDANWNEEAVTGWRFSASELKKRRAAGGAPKQRRRREA